MSDGWPNADPTWPDGVVLRDVHEDDLAGLHRLIYDEARFADVPGHRLRDLDDWRQIFLGERDLAGGVVLACRDERMVGASLVRTFSDGTGWISQLAVAPGERGRGLGRALVLESFRRLVASGASALGLGVMAANRGALGLYLDIGLSVDREWQQWELPDD